MQKKYFHELPQKEVEKLMTTKKTWRYVVENYRQPDWCRYEDALAGKMGCWSLVDISSQGDRKNISKEFCSKCDYFNPEFK